MIAEELEGRVVVLADDDDAERLLHRERRDLGRGGVLHATDNPAMVPRAPFVRQADPASSTSRVQTLFHEKDRHARGRPRA